MNNVTSRVLTSGPGAQVRPLVVCVGVPLCVSVYLGERDMQPVSQLNVTAPKGNPCRYHIRVSPPPRPAPRLLLTRRRVEPCRAAPE